ncbi:hypothetical protein Namu_1109 [Nakamurella multipartita DSM 44233]|uniref:Uncharacterized protein n=1 Tax=Nakamurella multipartita (strain ATCC 700099 / DSM 44233 / CIP 104796 / JCM 9543 / NBRC 105858 / Y-104) TaxID=479431 RepID=C8XCF1_NAKMY|nr:hypothetical protein Namu_1109 [Nakamurella multipartita DSM 44233]
MGRSPVRSGTTSSKDSACAATVPTASTAPAASTTAPRPVPGASLTDSSSTTSGSAPSAWLETGWCGSTSGAPLSLPVSLLAIADPLRWVRNTVSRADCLSLLR